MRIQRISHTAYYVFNEYSCNLINSSVKRPGLHACRYKIEYRDSYHGDKGSLSIFPITGPISTRPFSFLRLLTENIIFSIFLKNIDFLRDPVSR